MPKKTLLILLIAVLALLNTSTVLAESIQQDEIRPVCIPNGYHSLPSDCLDMGPTAYMSDMAELGIYFPQRELPSQDSIYLGQELEYKYAKTTVDKLRIFRSAQEAYKGEKPSRTWDPGQIFVSIEDHEYIGGKTVYMINPGAWVRWDEISLSVYPSIFGGLEFFDHPELDFGWTIYMAYTYREPTYDSDYKTGYYRDKYEFVQIYDRYETEQGRWIMVGPDEWMDARTVGQVYSEYEKPEGIDSDRWIFINLFEQTVAVYENDELIYATLTATGLDKYMTRPGLFKITEKDEDTFMAGSVEEDKSDYYFLENVPWNMYFDDRRALHAAYWHDGLGVQRSHGCVNLSPGDARWIYEWSQVGDWVYVWDPSGKTEVDEALLHIYDQDDND